MGDVPTAGSPPTTEPSAVAGSAPLVNGVSDHTSETSPPQQTSGRRRPSVTESVEDAIRNVIRQPVPLPPQEPQSSPPGQAQAAHPAQPAEGGPSGVRQGSQLVASSQCQPDTPPSPGFVPPRPPRKRLSRPTSDAIEQEQEEGEAMKRAQDLLDILERAQAADGAIEPGPPVTEATDEPEAVSGQDDLGSQPAEHPLERFSNSARLAKLCIKPAADVEAFWGTRYKDGKAQHRLVIPPWAPEISWDLTETTHDDAALKF